MDEVSSSRNLLQEESGFHWMGREPSKRSGTGQARHFPLTGYKGPKF